MADVPRIRRPRNCPRCRYEVVGLHYGTPCPECGQSLLVEDVARYLRENTPFPHSFWTIGFVAAGVTWFALFAKLAFFAPMRPGSFVGWALAPIPVALLVLAPVCFGLVISRVIRKPFVRSIILWGWLVAGTAALMIVLSSRGRGTDVNLLWILPLTMSLFLGLFMVIHACAAWFVDEVRAGRKRGDP